MKDTPRIVESVCPYLNRDDPRCAAHLRLGRLGQAFDLCLSRPGACAIHQQIRRDRRPLEPTRINITIQGRRPRLLAPRAA